MRLPIILLCVAAGCGGEQYVYTPEVTNAQQSGLPASQIQIPPERPEGTVQITSSGVTTATPDSGTKVDVIHVRMAVANNGDPTPWTLDTSQQFLEIPGEGRSAPLFVNADTQTMPQVTIAKGERHVIDLFYPLPANAASEKKLPQFDLMWTVNTGERPVASRTSFERQEIEPQVAYGYDYGYGYPYYAGFGPYWWYDPFYGNTAFVHSHPYHFRGGNVGHVHVSGYHGHYNSGFHGQVAHGGGGSHHR